MNSNIHIENFARLLWAEYMKSLFGDEKYTSDWEEKSPIERAAWMDMARAANREIKNNVDELLDSLIYLRDCIEAGTEPALGMVNQAISKANGSAA